jgi:hypothetical protein
MPSLQQQPQIAQKLGSTFGPLFPNNVMSLFNHRKGSNEQQLMPTTERT